MIFYIVQSQGLTISTIHHTTILNSLNLLQNKKCKIIIKISNYKSVATKQNATVHSRKDLRVCQKIFIPYCRKTPCVNMAIIKSRALRAPIRIGGRKKRAKWKLGQVIKQGMDRWQRRTWW